VDVWKALEDAKASVNAKVEALERVRERIPFEGAKAVNLANVYTYMIDVLERISSILECLGNAKETNAVSVGKNYLRVRDSKWFVEVADGGVVLKRLNPALTITVTPESVRIATRTKEDKEIKREAVLTNSEFEIRRDKLEVKGRYADYDQVYENSYYIRKAFRELAREVMKKGEPLIQHMKFMNVSC